MINEALIQENKQERDNILPEEVDACFTLKGIANKHERD